VLDDFHGRAYILLRTAASIPIETQKPLVNDEEAIDVDVHLYISMIGSLMYLTASKPDIMFAICACFRFHVTPKLLHLHAVKRIFRRLISWQCKKQTIIATFTTEAEYLAAANCCEQHNLVLPGKKLVLPGIVSAAKLPLEKTKSNVEFHQIVDFLTMSSIHHSLTGEGSSSGLGHQETMGGAMDQIRFESALMQSINPPLSIGYTIRSGEDRMEHDIELTDPVPQKPYNSPLSEGHIPGSDEGSMKLKELTDLCTTLLQKVFDLENVKTTQAKEIASLTKRITKLKQRQSSRLLGFYPFRAGSSKRHSLDRRKDANTEMIVKNKGNGEKGGSIAETISIARPDISAVRPEDSTAEPKTPPTTTTLFDDEDVTIANTLKSKKIDQDQIERDAKVALKIQADLNKEAHIERERQKEASKAALAKMYDEVQEQIDADHELAVRLTLKEQEKYTVKERFTYAQLKSRSFEEIQKLYIKEQKWKMNDQDSEENDKEHRKCLKVVPDDDKVIDYETFDVKSPIVDVTLLCSVSHIVEDFVKRLRSTLEEE
nr:hypothetical protein [Tanacetum cinerariifolium]